MTPSAFQHYLYLHLSLDWFQQLSFSNPSKLSHTLLVTASFLFHVHTTHEKNLYFPVYLSNICQPIHHQGLLPVIVIVQVQHRHPKRVDDTTASGSFIPRIKGVHNDGLRPLYFAATEWAALAVWLLHKHKNRTDWPLFKNKTKQTGANYIKTIQLQKKKLGKKRVLR